MDTTKKIARAVLNKNFAEAKELVFKSLYARASLSLDEARYAVADAVFNSQPEQIDEISKATKDSYVAKRGSQMSSMMRGPEKNYPSLTGKKQANAVKGIKRAMGVKEETEQLDEVSPPGMEKMTGSKKVKAAFTKRYGKRGREVMYATAWKQHNKKMAESAELEEGSAVPSRKEALAAIRWGKKAMKDPAKHGVTPDDIRANMKVARDTLRPFGSKKSAPKKMAEETEQIDEVMTRKHFQQVADVIKSNPDAKKREELAAHHSQIFKKSNPRFDEKRFRKACGVGGCD